jgi:hypothetical protein
MTIILIDSHELKKAKKFSNKTPILKPFLYVKFIYKQKNKTLRKQIAKSLVKHRKMFSENRALPKLAQLF